MQEYICTRSFHKGKFLLFLIIKPFWHPIFLKLAAYVALLDLAHPWPFVSMGEVGK